MQCLILFSSSINKVRLTFREIEAALRPGERDVAISRSRHGHCRVRVGVRTIQSRSLDPCRSTWHKIVGIVEFGKCFSRSNLIVSSSDRLIVSSSSFSLTIDHQSQNMHRAPGLPCLLRGMLPTTGLTTDASRLRTASAIFVRAKR